MYPNSRLSRTQSQVPYVWPPKVAMYQVNANHLARDLPAYLNFLRHPPMNMNDIIYKRMKNGRLVVERKEEAEETPTEIATEIATEVDSNDEPVLRYFDMDVELGEADMEIDEDYIDSEMLSEEKNVNSADEYTGDETEDLEVYDSDDDMDIKQEDNPDEKMATERLINTAEEEKVIQLQG
ncbi:hypothetical protein D9619_000036 [Psilocybe cf. subviscida]|uniref:Uncharacterized protein n=1 Tax=Psilocybe cf. subviscida TaxID=2480587 RepID=A0A8H5BCY3_9AGAR|nr:hypothetical protein D9619_000036 [Psilocybe cf. subviscida]